MNLLVCYIISVAFKSKVISNETLAIIAERLIEKHYIVFYNVVLI